MRWIGLLCLAGLPAISSGAGSEPVPVPEGEASGVVYPEPVGTLAIPAPIDIRHLLDAADSVVIRVRIGPDGDVLDFVPLDLPHRGLLWRVDELVPKMRFTPAVDNGVPFVADIDVKIPVTRTSDLGIVNETMLNHIESQAIFLDPNANRMSLTPAKQLDKPLQLVSQGQQVIGVDEDQNVLQAETEVEFYVDTRGVPRMIRAFGESPDFVQQAAIQTVSNFRFSPPQCRGEPTVVKGRIKIRQGG